MQLNTATRHLLPCLEWCALAFLSTCLAIVIYCAVFTWSGTFSIKQRDLFLSVFDLFERAENGGLIDENDRKSCIDIGVFRVCRQKVWIGYDFSASIKDPRDGSRFVIWENDLRGFAEGSVDSFLGFEVPNTEKWWVGGFVQAVATARETYIAKGLLNHEERHSSAISFFSNNGHTALGRR